MRSSDPSTNRRAPAVPSTATTHSPASSPLPCSVMARAAADLGCEPRELSFTGALQAVRSFGERLLEAEGPAAGELHEWLLIVVGAQRVGDRPDGVGPRARKRR